MSTENIHKFKPEYDTDRAMELVVAVESEHKVFFEPGTDLWGEIANDIGRDGYTNALYTWNENVRVGRDVYIKRGQLTIHPDATLVWKPTHRQ